MANGDRLVLGVSNAAANTTTLHMKGPDPWGFDVTATNNALVGHSDELYGVQGISNAGPSEFGDDAYPAGVNGWGNSAANGVLGVSRQGIGVDGRGRIGVRGRGFTSFGVQGVSTFETGVYGHSDVWTGIVGSTNNPAGNYAGYFWGPVGVNGNLTVWGKKSAAVPFPDGSHRLLYAVESPESWFEDFGSVRLVRGRARVRIDRHFAKVVRLAGYHVFITPEGNSRGLYISKKNKEEFEVREQQGGTSSVRFSYRVVARRKDVAAKRFARVALPRRPEIPKPVRPPAPLRTPGRKSRVPATSKRRRAS
jgi:hypothetical protein